MRVLIINRMLLMGRGGGETFDLEVGHALVENGDDVEYLSARPFFGRALVKPVRSECFQIIRSPYWGWVPWDRVPGAWRLRVHDFRVFQHRAVKWVLKHESRYDVIQVCELPEFVQEYKKCEGKRPVVARLTAPDYYDPYDGFSKADAIIASGATMEAVRSKNLMVNDVPNGVDTREFNPGVSEFRKRWPEGTNIALCVARFQSVKGHEILLRAFKKVACVHKWILVLAGSGPEMTRMKNLCRRLELTDSVEFLGETSHAALPDIYRAADVVVIPSLYESFCFAALEGMACGKPILSSATPWIPRLLGGTKPEETAHEVLPGGCVVPIGDSDALAQAMLHLDGNAKLREEMGTRNRKVVVKNYGWTESAKKLRQIYDDLVQRG